MTELINTRHSVTEKYIRTFAFFQKKSSYPTINSISLNHFQREAYYCQSCDKFYCKEIEAMHTKSRHIL